MSTATIPFLCRRGFLPFCPREATIPVSGYDYVSITDEQAIQLFWMLEQVTFVPTGSVSPSGYSFTKSFSSPGPNTTGLTNFNVDGAVVAGEFSTSASTPSVQPANKVCSDGELITTNAMYSSGAYSERFSVSLYLAYSSGWRLYYKFSFSFASFRYEILNPSGTPGAAGLAVFDTSGTLSLLGLTLSWSGYVELGYTASGVGLSASSVNWTF